MKKRPLKRKREEECQKQSIVSLNRARNIEIMLSQFKDFSNPSKDFTELIESLDDSKLSISRLHTLMKCAPTEEEEKMLLAYKGNVSDLSKIDALLLSIAKISRFRENLTTLDYLLQFDDYVTDLDGLIQLKYDACQQLMKSKKFTRVLEIILAIGNTLNRGTTGNACGFKLDVLNSLGTTKSSDGKTTLLHFLSSIAIKEMDSSSFRRELSQVGPASKISSSQVQEQFETIKQQLNHFRKEIEYYKTSNNYQALTKLAKFYDLANAKFEKLSSKLQKLDQVLQKTLIHYGEDAKDNKKKDEIFQIVSDFCDQFSVTF